jgi:hypothetical protein
LGHVAKSEFGISKKWNFCFDPAFWRAGSVSLAQETTAEQRDAQIELQLSVSQEIGSRPGGGGFAAADVEDDVEGQGQAPHVHLKRLHKSFQTEDKTAAEKIAVNQVRAGAREGPLLCHTLTRPPWSRCGAGALE